MYKIKSLPMRFYYYCIMPSMKLLNLALLLLLSLTVFSQQPRNINISARVVDTLGETVPVATVMLLNSSDSTLINYTTSDSNGEFGFKNIKNSGYILKISHVSYMPIQRDIPVINQADYNMGDIVVAPIAEILMEVVIKSAKAPLFIHGDTVEYDARLFKVPPGSTVEDLLRRLPGVEVDADGNITTMGKNINRVYVDGKTFFGDDPSSVTKNLDAEAISKVKVYDEKSEQERLTGIDDGSDEKVMNLELKDDFKKGHFGKASIAGGTEQRWAARGSFNRFNEISQLSFLGFANNMNNSGVNWDEYTEFKGSSAYSDFDNGDFGFGSGRGHRSLSMIGGNYSNKGFTKNYGGGVNYNYFNKKTKFNASYFYNQSDLTYDQFTKRQTFLNDTSYFRYDTTDNYQFNNSHTVSSRFEYEFDSANTAIIRVNARLSENSNTNNQFQIYQTNSSVDINSNTVYYSATNEAYSVNVLGLYNHKFKKKRRSFSFSAVADLSDNNSDNTIDNINEYFLTTNEVERINLLYDNQGSQNNFKSSLMYVEPFGKRLSLMTFYNFSNKIQESAKLTKDVLASNSMIDSLSNYYIHSVLYNRLGASLNYAWEGLNISMGGAYQIIGLKGDYALTQRTEPRIGLPQKDYMNFVPYFSANWELPNNMRIYGTYSYNINEPSMTQLQPVSSFSNSLYRIEGNTNLVPERSHSISAGAYYWDRASFTNVSLSFGANLNENSIVYNKSTEFVDSIGYVTVSKPENVEGGNSYYAYLWSNVPIIKTILSLNVSGNVRFSENPVYINSIKNITKTDSYGGRLGLDLNIGAKLNINIDGRVSTSNVKYSLQTNQNQVILNYSSEAGFKWQFAKKSYLEGNFTWSNYQSDRLDYVADIMLLNVSIRQLIGKNNRFEVRLAAFDLLNQKEYLYQVATENYTEYTSSPTLARYFMLSVSYNLKGFEESNNKRRRW